MRRQCSPKGQLLLPMLSVLFLFGLFWITFVLWSRHIYWRMRMDMAADATALSAMRDEAAMLNTISTLEYLENPFLQKAKLFGEDIAGVQVFNIKMFTFYNSFMKSFVDLYGGDAYGVAKWVASA